MFQQFFPGIAEKESGSFEKQVLLLYRVGIARGLVKDHTLAQILGRPKPSPGRETQKVKNVPLGCIKP